MCGETDVSQCLTIIDQTILFYFLPHPPVPPDALSAALWFALQETPTSLCAGARMIYVRTLDLTQITGVV